VLIRNLIIKKKPTSLEVNGSTLYKIEVTGKVKYWPENTSGEALFLFEFSSEVSDDELKKNRISKSAIGPYVYLNTPKDDNSFHQEISIPKGDLKKIHLQLWNSKHEILFEEVCFSSHGGTLYSEHEFKEDITLNNLNSHFEFFPKNSEISSFNLLSSQKKCTPKCHAICSHWYKTMDDYAKSHSNIDAKRTNFNFSPNNEYKIPLTAYHSNPAMLSIPSTIDSYMYDIGDKSRNMIKKAIKLGYSYKKVIANNYIDDIINIRTSDTLRQGQAIPEYFYQRPDNILSFDSGCALHGEEFFGIFKDNELIAYSTIFLYGELAQVNHILGHKDHLQNGVMNLLVFEIINSFINSKPWIKGINYLYPGSNNIKKGTGLFKKSVGFREQTIVTTQAVQDINTFFKDTRKNNKPENTTKLTVKIKVKKPTPDLVLIDNSEEIILEKEAHKFTENSLGISEGITINTIYYDVTSESFINEANTANDFNTVIIKNLTLENYTDFLSHGIKNLSEKLTKNSFVIFDFITEIETPQEKNTILTFLSDAFKNKDNELIEKIIDYISRRFRSLDTASIRNGFKSGDYAVKGIINYQKNIDKFGFDSLIVLKKIH
jgi:hypothetical protein